jgi:outer membrane receptor protein involved in Fe transport
MRAALATCSISALLAGMTVCNVAHAETPASPSADKGEAPLEIVVTAQKRTENILSVPASVSVIGGDRLSAQHATQLQDYAAYVPGLQVDSGGTPGQTSITLRGIAPIGSGAAVGTYIDDAPLGSSGLYAFANSFQLDLMPYDLKGVEILRGPQGTLYGASTMGGLVKYVLEQADTDTFRAAIGGDLLGVRNGDSVGGGVRGMVNLPLVPGTLAIRASGFYERTPGYIDNPVQKKNGINDVRQKGARIALAWTPTSNIKVTLDALYQKVASDDNAVVTLDPAGQHTEFGDLTSDLPMSQPFMQRTAFFKGTLSWDLPFATLTSVSSYGSTRNLVVQDASPIFVTFFPAYTGDAGYAPQTVDLHLHKFTQEIRLTSKTGGVIEWMLGGFLTTEQMRNDQLVRALGSDFKPGVLDPLLTASLPTRYREQAAFGNLTWNVVGGWSITGGLRYSHNSQRYTQITGGLLVGGSDTEYGRSSENVTTYSVSTKYQFNPSTMVYARVASGYQPGGPNVTLPGVPPTVSSSTLTNYEAGFKTRTLDQKLMLDLSVYRIDWRKIQTIAATTTGLQYLTNGGQARSQGVEASAVLQATRRFSFGGTFAYTDAKFTTGIAALGTVPGQRLPLVPRYSASFHADYKADLGSGWSTDISGGLRYAGARPAYLFIAPSPPAEFHEAGYVVADLNAQVSNGGWTIGVFAKNLLDRRAYLTKTGMPDALLGSIVQVNAAVLQPRTIGLSLDRKF